ncbi:MAG: aspartate 1-decarboxylase [Desulfohalobiaceae bacterium]|nr:aspartate 1-decarboxylase [Desulfohalobiaceae bacterium]
MRCFLQAKIHQARLTGTNVEYHGSLAVCPSLLQASGLLPNERVDVYNLDNGNRLTTYIIEGDTGEIALNGAAALKGAVGERIIIASYAWLTNQEMREHTPRVVLVDENNKIHEVKG